jgi:formate dehydrogenase subunit delta
MDVVKLVRMANQIAANFDGGSDESQAVAGVADHIGRFWSPLMREQLIAHWRQDPSDLSPRAAQAIASIADSTASA